MKVLTEEGEWEVYRQRYNIYKTLLLFPDGTLSPFTYTPPSLLPSPTPPSPLPPSHLHPQPPPQLQVCTLAQVLVTHHGVIPISRHRERQRRENSILDETTSQLKPQCQLILHKSVMKCTIVS